MVLQHILAYSLKKKREEVEKVEDKKTKTNKKRFKEQF